MTLPNNPDKNKKDSTWYGRLIQIKNVHFTWENDSEDELQEKYVSLRRSIEDTKKVTAHQLSGVFAPSTYDISKKYNIGYPMSRGVSDGTGTLYISTSEYAHFAETFIPKKGSVGTVTAILGWFRDKKNYDGKYQLTIRSLDDLEGFEYESYPREYAEGERPQ